MTHHIRFLFVLILLAWPAGKAPAQVLEGLPSAAEGIGVDQKSGNTLPLYLDFDDDKNNQVFVQDLFDGKIPVLLSFNYSNCPQLCVIQLNNLVAALHSIDLKPGRDFRIVSVSLDPNEQITDLIQTKRNCVVASPWPDAAEGWRFLRGKRKNIKELADACGFRYKYVPEQKIYSHPSAFIFCTPDGRIARYLDGLNGDLPKTLKPALLEAGQGKIGSVMDRVLYFSGCYVYDPATGKYSMSAMRLMRFAGAGTVIVLLVMLIPYWVRRNAAPATKKRKTDPVET